MLFFLSEPEPAGSYFQLYNGLVRAGLVEKGVPFTEIPLSVPYLSEVNFNAINKHKNRPHDIWLFAQAQNPLIRYAKSKKGEKYAHVHALNISVCGNHYGAQDLFQLYDGLFTSTEWAAARLAALCKPSCRLVRCGWPLDNELLQSFSTLPKIPKSVAFNQEFCLQNLHILEVHLATALLRQGFSVTHIALGDESLQAPLDRECIALRNEAVKRGINLVTCSSRQEFYYRLTHHQLAIVTAISDAGLLAVLEAASLGVAVIAPDWGPYRELLPPGLLYPPYNTEVMLQIASSPPTATVLHRAISPAELVSVYLKGMEAA